jgi:hypothetical protein
MYALITNGIATKFTYTIGDLRRDNPQVSFPKIIPPEILAAYGMVEVQTQATPDYNPATQRVQTSYMPELVDGVWTMTKTVVDKDADQIAADTASKSVEIRNKRNELLSDSDWTQVLDAPVDRTTWANYRQALRDITDQAGFPFSVVWPSQPT